MVCTLLSFPERRACAIDAFWSNFRGDGSGTFSSATNWSPSVPGANDVAHFGMTTSSLDPKTYTVAFVGEATNQKLVVEDDLVTFDLNGHVYRTPGASNVIGNVPGRTARLTITDGAWDDNLEGSLTLGDGLNAAGVLTVSTGGKFLGETIFVGSNAGPGTLVIQNGGMVTSPHTLVGAFGAGTATVTGTNSTLNVAALNVGESATGTLSIAAGGKVVNSGPGRVGSSFESGTVNVDGANSLWTNAGFIDIGRGGHGEVHVTSGAHVELGTTSVGIKAASLSGDGVVTVDGVNSQLVCTSLFMTNATLNVSGGGLVQGTTLALGGGVVKRLDHGRRPTRSGQCPR